MILKMMEDCIYVVKCHKHIECFLIGTVYSSSYRVSVPSFLPGIYRYITAIIVQPV